MTINQFSPTSSSSSTSGSSSSDLAAVEATIGSSLKPVHLIVLCHGLWGEPKHLRTVETLLANSFGDRATVINPTSKRFLKSNVDTEENKRKNQSENVNKTKKQIKEEKQQKEEEELDKLYDKLLSNYSIPERDERDLMDVVILNTTTNQGGKTYDGIDWLAERVLLEIKDEQKSLRKQGKEIKRYSMIGYSLGGLVTRFVLGLLESQSFFEKVQPKQVITIATPHIGIPPGSGAFRRLASFVGGRLLSRTGEQIYCLDQGWQSGKSEEKVGLLEYMSKPNSIFIRALNRFEKVHFYANAVNDFTVPFRTGCIELWDPFIEQPEGYEVELLKDCPILTNIEFFEPEQKSFLQVVKSKIASTPFFFNPKRIPMNFPYNYILFISLPLLLPFFAGSVIYRLSKDNRRSKLRIEELERGWSNDFEEEGSTEQDRSSETRMSNLIKRLVIGAGEENVERELDMIPDIKEDDDHQHISKKQSNSNKPPWHSPLIKKDESKESYKQPKLMQSQQNMVNNINNSKNIPKLTKVWTYYPDVTNCHAIIVARTLSIEPHRRGLPIVKHLVDDFLP